MQWSVLNTVATAVYRAPFDFDQYFNIFSGNLLTIVALILMGKSRLHFLAPVGKAVL